MTEEHEPNRARRRSAKRIVGAAGALSAAAIAAANVASASFSGTRTQAPTVGAATLSLSLGAGGGVNRLNTTVNGLYPSSTANIFRERAVDVTNGGTINYSALSVTIAASGADTTLATDANGIQLYVDECSTAWTETAGTTPDEYTYACGGSSADVLNTELPQVVNTNGTSKTFAWDKNVTYTAGAVNHLRFRFKLPSSAPDSLQGKSVTLTITFDGTQRAGAYK